MSKLKEYTIKEKTGAIVYCSSNITLDNTYWEYFGYNKRPEHNRIMTLLMNKNKLHIENFLTREIFISTFSVYLKKAPLPNQYITCFCNQFLDDILKNNTINHVEASTYFKNAIKLYLDSDSLSKTMIYRYEDEFQDMAPINIQTGAQKTEINLNYLPDISYL